MVGMKIRSVQSGVIIVPVLPKIRWQQHDLTTTEIQKRYVVLQPRTLNGHVCMVAYDQETDTLFVKDD